MVGCLMIHGYTGGPYEISPLADFLKERTDWLIQVPTLEGHGRELDLKDVSYEVWLEDALNAYESLRERCDTIYLVGFSMGGMIAAYIAANYEVDKLVLLAPARKYISVKYISYYFGEVIADSVRGDLLENERYLNYKDKVGEIPFTANIEFMKLVNFTKDHLKEIDIPVFIVQGKMDGMVPYKTAYLLQEEIGEDHTEVVLFDQADHHLSLSKDAPIIHRLVFQFLTKKERKLEQDK